MAIRAQWATCNANICCSGELLASIYDKIVCSSDTLWVYTVIHCEDVLVSASSKRLDVSQCQRWISRLLCYFGLTAVIVHWLRPLSWFKCTVYIVLKAHLGSSVGGYLSRARIHSQSSMPYQQSGARMLNRLICQGWLRKILIGTPANHPVDLKYRPATKSHYTQ